jgi:hypothetical protein
MQVSVADHAGSNTVEQHPSTSDGFRREVEVASTTDRCVPVAGLDGAGREADHQDAGQHHEQCP